MIHKFEASHVRCDKGILEKQRVIPFDADLESLEASKYPFDIITALINVTPSTGYYLRESILSFGLYVLVFEKADCAKMSFSIQNTYFERQSGQGQPIIANQ